MNRQAARLTALRAFARWWLDAVGVAALAVAAACESRALGAPGPTVAALVFLGGAYVVARATARLEFRRGWLRGVREQPAGTEQAVALDSAGRCAVPPEPWHSPGVSGRPSLSADGGAP